MAARYRCGSCRTTSDWLHDTDVAAHRKQHRDRFHGGDAPDDEELIKGTAPMFHGGILGGRELLAILAAVLVLAFLWDLKN
ncbi:hypothetical protein [Streptomyces sp. NPDC056056]|uniref:hypothetical protein n=1 Tax=Streptomyces sp. NPDC056056 TaxID=3345698 RepID=UPI0035E13EF0